MNWNKRMVRMVTIMIVLLLLCFSVEVAAARGETSEPLKELDLAAEALYHDMQNGNVEGAHEQIEKVTQIVQGLSFTGLTSVEGIHALTESIMDVQQTLVKAEPSVETWAVTSARLRLAINSLVHKNEAMWLQYHKIMVEDLKELAKARNEGSLAAVRGAFVSLHDHYEMIRPAAMIGKGSSSIVLMDSWISYLERASADPSLEKAKWNQTLDQGTTLLNQLFGRNKDEPVLLPLNDFSTPWRWTLLIGGWIAVALLYTAFRKYRTDQQLQAVSRKNSPSQENNDITSGKF